MLQRVLALVTAGILATTAQAATDALVVTGLGGEPAYATAFAEQSAAIERSLATLPGEVRVTRLTDAAASLERIADWFGTRENPDTLLVFLVGHGSFDDIEYKFNIPGPDFTDADLVGWLDDAGGTQLVVLTGSASGAAADTLAADNRLVVSATRSGVERHATRFGEFFAAALGEASADLDKNERISVQEAFDFATRAVADSYAEAQQLATEHARLDGDGAARLVLARLAGNRTAAPAADPELNRLREVRDRISAEIDALRATRDNVPAAVYRAELTELLVDLASAEEAIDAYLAER